MRPGAKSAILGSAMGDESKIQSTSAGGATGLGPPAPEPPACADCGAELAGRFCSECGQRDAGRLTFRRIAEETFDHVLSLDSALLRTAVDLSRSPGRVCRDYVAGRRKTYMSPLKYTFVTATVFALLVNLLDVLPSGLPADNEQAVKLFKLIVSALGYLAYVYMLPVAVLQRLLFRGRDYGVAESYASLLYFYGHFLLLGSVLSAFGAYSMSYGQLAMRGLGLIYFVWLVAGFYRSPEWWTYLRGFLLYLFFTAISMGSGFVLAILMGVRPR